MIKESKVWLNILKILACFNVIINHVSIIKIGNTNNEILFHCIQFALSKVAVPIFIMITAALLINKKIDFKYITEKIFKIIIILISLSFLVYFGKYIFGTGSFNVFDFTQKFFTSSIISPYWYLYMLVGLYLMIPILNKMLKKLNIKDLRYIVLLSLIVPSAIVTIEKITNFYLDYSFTISFFTIIISYYISGIYLTKEKLTKKNKNIALLAFIIPILLLIIYMFLTGIINNEISYVLDDYKAITTSLPSLSLFYLIRYYFENKKLSSKIKKAINTISRLTFGVYLFHPIFIFKIYKLEFIQLIYSINNVLGIIIFEIILFTVCLIMTYVLKKIPIIKKFL